MNDPVAPVQGYFIPGEFHMVLPVLLNSYLGDLRWSWEKKTSQLVIIVVITMHPSVRPFAEPLILPKVAVVFLERARKAEHPKKSRRENMQTLELSARTERRTC